MVGITFTPNLHLSLLPSNYRVWTQQMNDNLGLIDAAISAFVSFNNLRGVWQNSTQYAIGDTVSDGLTAVLYTSSEAHLSPVIPATFEDERLAHPNRWAVVGRAASNRGAWTPATSYLVNDFVLADGTKYAMCLIAHTSGGTFAADLALGRWAVMIDLSAAGSLVLPVLSGAPDANKFTGTNAAGTNYINFDGTEAMARLAGVLNVARGGTGVQDFTGTGTKFVKQTDPLFLNTITVAATADAMVVSEALNNSSTGANAGIQQIINVGGRIVQRVVSYIGQYLQENTVGIFTRYSDFDTHVFRNNAGIQTARIDSSGTFTATQFNIGNLAFANAGSGYTVIYTQGGQQAFALKSSDSYWNSDAHNFVNAAGNVVAVIGSTGQLVQFGTTSGTITVNAPAVAGANTITWPAASGVVALVNAGATATNNVGAGVAQQNFVTAGVYVNGTSVGPVGANGEKWMVIAVPLIHNSAGGGTLNFYSTRIHNGTGVISERTISTFGGSQIVPTLFTITTLTGPTTFTLQAANLSTAGGGDINSSSEIFAVRLA